MTRTARAAEDRRNEGVRAADSYSHDMFREHSLILRFLLSAARRPRMTLAFAAMAAALGFYGTTRLHPTGSLESMLSRTDPSARALADIVRDFGVADELIVVVTDLDSGNARDAAPRLGAFAARLEAAARRSPDLSLMGRDVLYRDPPDVRRFFESEVVPAGVFYLGDEPWGRLRERLSESGIRQQIHENETLIATGGPAAHALSQSLLKDPLRLHQFLLESLADALPARPTDRSGLLLSDDGRSLMIRLRGARPVADLDFAKAFVAGVSEAIRSADPAGFEIELTGAYAIAVTAERSIRSDMIRSITGSLVLLGLLFLIVYRRASYFPLALTPVAVGAVLGFGLSSLYSTELTPLVAVIGAVLCGVAIDYAIHFLSHVSHSPGPAETRHPAIEETIRHIAPAMILACATAVIGFLAVASSSVRALRQFALIGAAGLACSLFGSLTILPALLTLVSPRLRPLRREAGLQGLLERWIPRLKIARIWLVTGASATCLVLGAIPFIGPDPGIRFEDDLTVMHPRPNPPLEAQRRLADRFGSHPEPLMLLQEGDSPDQLVKLSYEVKERLSSPIAPVAGVRALFGLSTLLPDPRVIPARIGALQTLDIERILSGFDRAIAESLFDSAAYREYREFLRRLLTPAATPDLSTLAGYPQLASMLLPRDAAAKPEAIHRAVTLVIPSGDLEDRPFRSSLIEGVRAALSGVNGVTLTGVSVVAHDTENLIRRELLRVLQVAAAIVVIGVVAYFRNWRDAALALLPLVFGQVCLLGVMHLADLRFNLVNLVGLSLPIGLGVDNGIFLVTIRRNARRWGPRRTLEQYAAAGHAIVMTTLTNFIPFGMLIFTSTPAIQSLGVTMTIALTTSGLGVFFLLLPILLWTSPGEDQETREPALG